MHRSFPLFSALGVLALAGACSSGASDLGPTGTVGPAPTLTSTTTQAIDVGVIPDDPADIDEAYVQAVVDALFAVDAQATKIFVETKKLDDRAIEILESIYVGEELDQQLNNWFQVLAQRPDEVLAGQLQHSVERILGKTSDCVLLVAERDFGDTTTNTVDPTPTYLGITTKKPGDDPQTRNPTSWMLFSDSISIDGQPPEDLCDGS